MQQLAQKAALLLIGVLGALGLVEIWLRVLPPRDFARILSAQHLYQPDPTLRYTLRPNLDVYALSESGDAYSIKTNDHGLRDVPYRPDDSRRTILGLGDSFLFGQGVAREEAMLGRLGNLLEDWSPGRFRTINAGVEGYSTNQEILYYLQRGHPTFRPETVILFFYINDLVLHVSYGKINYYMGIPIPEASPGQGLLASDGDTPSTPGIPGGSHQWRMVDFAKYLREVYQIRTSEKKYLENKPSFDIEARIFSREFFPKEAWRIKNVENMLKLLHQEVRMNGAKLLVVYVPSAREVEEGSARKKYYRHLDADPARWDWDRPGDEVGQAVSSAGIPFVDLRAAFKSHWQQTGRSLYFHGYGHFTPAGHRLAADAILPHIQNVLQPEPAEVSAAGSALGPPGAPDIRKTIWGHTEDVYRKIEIVQGDSVWTRSFPVGPPPEVRIRIHTYVHSSPIRLAAADGLETLLIDEIPGNYPGWLEKNLLLKPWSRRPIQLSLSPSTAGGRAIFSAPYRFHRSSAARPPILWFAVSSMRADHLPMYGYGKTTTPHLADFLRDATLFEDVTSPSPWDLPALLTLLTGLDPFTHHVETESNRLPPEIPTAASILESAGYTTGAFVAAGSAGHTHLKHFQSIYEYPGRDSKGDLAFNRKYLRQWIESHASESFFLLFQTRTLEEPYTGTAFPREGQPGSLADTRARYDGGLYRLDDFWGEMFGLMRHKGIFDSALIVISGLHGEELGDRSAGRYGHGSGFLQEVIRVPLLIKWPDGTHPAPTSRFTPPAGLVDVLPTVLDAIHIPPPAILDGRSILTRPTAADPFFLMGAVRSGPSRFACAIRQGRFKLISIAPGRNKTISTDLRHIQLFDLDSDPGERVNLLVKNPGEFMPRAERLWNIFYEAGYSHYLRFSPKKIVADNVY